MNGQKESKTCMPPGTLLFRPLLDSVDPRSLLKDCILSPWTEWEKPTDCAHYLVSDSGRCSPHRDAHAHACTVALEPDVPNGWARGGD